MATVLFYILQKNWFRKVIYFSQIHHHTSYLDPQLSGIYITPTLQAAQ
jgi:hypothetical protein